jgi:predicted Zn-dependent peptidase
MHLKRLLLLVAILFYSVSQALAQSKIQFTEYELPNGLRVILHKDNSTPIVTVSVMYHVGSKNEQPNRTGFAHFFEHLLFEGSENLDRGDYMKIIKAAGGELNANTSNDRTFYYQVLPSNQLELGLYMESERLLHAKIDIKGVETQREVVKEERRLRTDNRPYGRLLEEVVSRAYKVHPYRWSVIGSMEHLNEAKLEEFVQFYKDFYVPNNAILSIAGDIDIDKTKALVTRYFGEIPKGTKPIYRPTMVEPPMGREIRDTVYDNVTLPAVVQAYHIPAQGTDDYYAINMLTTLLSGGESSRLNKEISEKQQKALQVAAFPFSLEHPGLFINFGLVNMGVPPHELEAALEVEIDKVKAELISDKEFQKLRNQMEAEFVSSNASTRGIAENLANYRMYFGDANLINSEIDRYMKVTREDIRRVAQKYLDKNNRVVLYWLPKPEKKS